MVGSGRGSGSGIIDRNQSFKKRSANIFKKSHELAVLCDIMVCTVVVGPNGEIETRPHNQIEAIKLFKQFKDNTAEAEEGRRKTNKKKVAPIKSKKLDFSFFDDNLVDGFSPKSVVGIRKILKSKIEAARNRVEFLKSKSGKDQESLAVTGFEINPTPNYDEPIFNYSEMMLNFPERNRVQFLNSKTGEDQESRAVTGFEIIPTPNYNEPIFSYSEMMLDIPERNRVELAKTGKDQESWTETGFEINPTPNPNYDQPILNYSEMMLGFLPPQLNLPGLEQGLNNRFPECAYIESEKQVGATELENNWNPNFDSEKVYHENFDNSNHRSAGSGGIFRDDSGNWLGTGLNSLPPNNWNPNLDCQMVNQDGYFHNSNYRNTGSGGVLRNDSGNWLGTGLNSLPLNNWNPNLDCQMVNQDGYFHNSNHRNTGLGGVLWNDSGNWLGTGMNSLPPPPPPPASSSIRVPDCRFGSESALPLEQVIGFLQPSPLRAVASMASTPLQPLTQKQLNWWFS